MAQATSKEIPGSRAQAQQRRALTTRELASRVRKSLVLILTQDHEGKVVAQGSGFFIGPKLVATNLHVLKWASQGLIKTASDGRSYKITDVVAFSLKHDVCVVYVADAAGTPLPEAVTPVAVGDDILAAGNPEGLEATFSTGIVSGIRTEAGLLQIDAPISPGSSGGPVVNRRGEAIGLTVSSLTEGQNLNFAVPIHFLFDRIVKRRLTVSVMGHLSVTDREYEGFHGPVSTYNIKESTYAPNETGLYAEGPSLATQYRAFTPDGRLKEVKQFSNNGKEIGSTVIEYSEDGLEVRHIKVNSEGQREPHQLSVDEQVAAATSRVHFDESAEAGDDGLSQKDNQNGNHFDTCKFNDMGQSTECFVLALGARFVMKYDENTMDWLVYAKGELRGKAHFTYEYNDHGDWIAQHATVWSSIAPNEGFVPLGETYRDISYFGENRDSD